MSKEALATPQTAMPKDEIMNESNSILAFFPHPKQTNPPLTMKGAVAAWTLPAKLYVDAMAFEKELGCLFKRSWLMFGVVHGRLDTPGSAWAQTLVPRTPLVAVRNAGKEGVKIYNNVCRHRAGPLLFDGTHTTGTKVCAILVVFVGGGGCSRQHL